MIPLITVSLSPQSEEPVFSPFEELFITNDHRAFDSLQP